MDRLARVKIDRYRLVGEDKLLVKQCVYRSAKSKQPTVAWPAVVPESMIPTILSLFHGDKSILHHAGKPICVERHDTSHQTVGVSVSQMSAQEASGSNTDEVQYPTGGGGTDETHLY